jgi:hypothetical protein
MAAILLFYWAIRAARTDALGRGGISSAPMGARIFTCRE